MYVIACGYCEGKPISGMAGGFGIVCALRQSAGSRKPNTGLNTVPGYPTSGQLIDSIARQIVDWIAMDRNGTIKKRNGFNGWQRPSGSGRRTFKKVRTRAALCTDVFQYSMHTVAKRVCALLMLLVSF